MCNSILQLFDGEKVAKAVRSSDAAAKANYTCVWLVFCFGWVETDYPLPLASLFPNFSTAKKLQKPFAAQTPPRKRGYVEDFTLKSVNAHRNPFCPSESSKTLVLHCPHSCVAKSPRDRRADGVSF